MARTTWLRALSIALLAATATSPSLFGVEMPSGIFHGKVAAIEGSAALGQLDAKDAAGNPFSCGYDARSYFEMDKSRVSATKLQAGDSIEVIADRKPGTRNCYARIVQVGSALVSRRAAAAPARPARVSDFLPPRGDRTFAGLVLRREGTLLTLKTRDGERSLVVRGDTRFLADGVKLDAASVPVNAHVFVRAGLNLYGQMEAFQVMWGEMINAPQ